MRSRSFRRGSRGVTALETLFALAFVFLLGLILLQLARGMSFYTEESAKIENMSDTRQVMDGTVRALRNARALGFCADDPQAGVPLDDCRQVSEAPFQIASATTTDSGGSGSALPVGGLGGSEVCFWGLFEPSTFQFEPLNLICVTENAVRGQVLLRTQQSAGDWTTPPIHHSSTGALDTSMYSDRTTGNVRNRLIGFVDSEDTVFTFFDADGNEIDNTALQTDAGKQAIALIRLRIVVTGGGDRRIGEGEARIELSYDVAPRGARYERDKAPAGGGAGNVWTTSTLPP